MTDTLVIFERNQFLLYDFKADKSWQVGDIDTDGFSVPEDACLVAVDGEKHRTNLCNALITGGFAYGEASDQVLALGFDMVTKNAVESYICNVVNTLPSMPAPRYMH